MGREFNTDFINMHNHFCLAEGYGNNEELEIAAVIKVFLA